MGKPATVILILNKASLYVPLMEVSCSIRMPRGFDGQCEVRNGLCSCLSVGANVSSRTGSCWIVLIDVIAEADKQEVQPRIASLTAWYRLFFCLSDPATHGDQSN